MKTRIIGYLLTALILSPVVVAGPLTETARCEGNCEVEVVGNTYGTGYNPYVPADGNGLNRAAEAEAETRDKVMDNLPSVNCNQECSNIGCGGSEDQGEVHLDYSHHGPLDESGFYAVTAYATISCFCQPIDLDSIGRRPVELTTAQKAINLYKNVKQSIFKRLFGRK